MTLEELRTAVEQQKALMSAVATGGPRIDDRQGEYVARRREIAGELKRRGLIDPNPHGDLWARYGYWSTNLGGWGPRRAYVSELYQPLLDAMDQAGSAFDDDGSQTSCQPAASGDTERTGTILTTRRSAATPAGRVPGCGPRDPLGETPAGSATSPYAYVHQRPTALIDPSGTLGCPRSLCRPLESFASSIAASPPAVQLKTALEGLTTAPGHAAARMPVPARADTGDQAAPLLPPWGSQARCATDEAIVGAAFIAAGVALTGVGALWLRGAASARSGTAAGLSEIAEAGLRPSHYLAAATFIAGGGGLAAFGVSRASCYD